MLSMLLVYHDPEFVGSTLSGRRIAPELALFPMRLGDDWRINFHLPGTSVAEVVRWLDNSLRLEEQNAFNLATPDISHVFFDAWVIQPLKDGLWRFMSLDALRPTDLTVAFTPMHFLLTLPGRSYPPQIPAAGLSLAEML